MATKAQLESNILGLILKIEKLQQANAELQSLVVDLPWEEEPKADTRTTFQKKAHASWAKGDFKARCAAAKAEAMATGRCVKVA
jgi:hypothetical protein